MRLFSGSWSIVAGVAWVAVVPPKGSGAQQVLIRSEVSCPSCRIHRDSVGTFGAPDGEGLGSVARQVVRDKDGYVYVAALPGPEISLFDLMGRLVRRIGRAGAGPGEFRSVSKLLVDEQRNLHVFDGRLVRHSVFARNGSLVSSIGMAVAGFADVALLRDESVIVNSGNFDRANAGYTLSRIDKSGTVTHRGDEVVRGAIQARWLERGLSVGQKSGRLIVTHPDEFVVEAFSGNLRRTMRLERSAAWFEGAIPGKRERSDGLYDVPPTARVISAWEDVGGLIWICAVVRSPAWAPRAPPVGGITLDSPEMTRPRYETVIEVIDPSTKRVLAREHSRERIGASDGYAREFRISENGTEALVLWKLRLVR